MMLGMLAVVALLLRTQAEPVPSAPALVYGTLCHTGGHQRAPGHPATDCDACVLCQAVHSDHSGMPILPSQAVLGTPSETIERLAVHMAPEPRRALRQDGFQPRAPPATA
jgi:hypothetical protein